MKSKTASVRLPKEMYEEIDGICNEIGCSRNDWIKDTLKDKLREESSELESKSFQDQNIKQDKEEHKEESIGTEIKEPIVTEIKEPQKITIKEVPQDNSQKPPITFTPFNGKLLPFAKRYNI